MKKPIEQIDIDGLAPEQLRAHAQSLRAELLYEQSSRQILQLALGQKQIEHELLQARYNAARSTIALYRSMHESIDRIVDEEPKAAEAAA